MPVAVLEAKKPQVSVQTALDQGRDYAERLGVDFVFACNGPTFKSLHAPSEQPLFLNNVEVTEPLAPVRLRTFWTGRTNAVLTVPHDVIESRAQLLDIFERLNGVLRHAGIRAGLERFTEFANILFLKLASEADPTDQTWNELLTRPDGDLPSYLNDFVIPRLRDRYASDVLTKTHVGGSALKAIVHELNPLHLTGVDEDLKGLAFEHFLRRTTAANNDLGEYFTPRAVVRFMVQLLNPAFGKTVIDPFCGTGGFLIEAFRHLGQQAPRSETASRVLHHQSLFGREITTTARVAKMNMILFGDGHSGVVQGDSLQRLPDDEGWYDYALSNIPFSLEIGDDAIHAVDPDARGSDQACLLRCFKSLKADGAMAVVIPEGLAVNRSHRDLWFRLFRDARVRVIATLPRGSFAPYTEAGTKVLYLTDKGRERTDWYYHVTLSGEKAKGPSIDMDEFLFFYQATPEPLEARPAGVEVVRVRNGNNRNQFFVERPWNIVTPNVVQLGEVADIANGQMLTEADATPGRYPIIGGGREWSFTHDAANTEGGCFTVSKSGAYAGFVWWHEAPIWASDCLIVRSHDEDEFLTFYLFLCLKAKQDEIYRRQQGTGQPHIYRQHIADFPIPRVSLADQWAQINEARDVMRNRIEAEEQETGALTEALDGIDRLYQADDTEASRPSPLRADYQGALPEQVAKALLRHRPETERRE